MKSEEEKGAVTPWQKLSGKISSVVEKMLEDRGVTKTQLAKEIHYAQSAISDTFNPDKPRRTWSFPLLLLVCEYLRIPVYKVIEAAEQGGEAPWLTLYLAKTPPNSMDRLELLVHTCASREEAGDARLMSLYYSAQMFENCAPQKVQSYLDGELGDQEIYDFLHRVLDNLTEGEPLWNGVKRAVGGK